MSTTKKILIVDDSALIRKGLLEIFQSSEGFDVVGEASNGVEALEAIEQYKPDVVTLDVVMPVMDGLTALKHIMIQSPCPVVMLSSLTTDGAETTFDAFRYGAIDYIAKGKVIDDDHFSDRSSKILNKVSIAAGVDISQLSYIRTNAKGMNGYDREKMQVDRVVVIGAAEGGFSALMKIIPSLKPGNMTYLVVLYESHEDVASLASYLDKHSALKVKCAVNDEILLPGVCYLSAGEDYASIEQRNDSLQLHVSTAPFSSRRGSIDRALFSVAETVHEKVIGMVLTGAGTDGVEGLEEVSRMAGMAIVQEPKNCLVQNMPQAVLEKCDVDFIASATEIAAILNKVSRH